MMRRTEFLRLALLPATTLPLPDAGEAPESAVHLGVAQLYAGLQAKRVQLLNGLLVLDTRNWSSGARGEVITDVIDLGGGGILSETASVTDLRVALDASPGVSIAVRTGETYFQTPGTWNEWAKPPIAGPPKGRYAQVRLELAAGDPAKPPSVSGVKLTCRAARPASKGSVTVIADQVQRIGRSPIQFGYERQDQADVQWLRKSFHLDNVIAGKRTEFERLTALMHWVATRANIRPGPWENTRQSYPWQIRRVMTEANGGTIYSHCMSYCEVMLAAASSFGWQGRHWAIHGVRDTSHEVPEIWVNELGKWVYFDPSLDTYYADPATGEPLNLLEMHERYLRTVFRPGEVQQRGRHVNEDRLRALRGKHPVRCVTGDYAYGKPVQWDWEWDHGYMTAGWLQLTPRNDWHSRPQPAFAHFGDGAEGYDGYPLFVDSQTPLTADATTWYTRKRDLWWTLNQASFRLIRAGETSLRVECGNSQPHFRRYLVRHGSDEWKPAEPMFSWTLRAGENRLEVAPEDEFGRRGISSSAVIAYRP